MVSRFIPQFGTKFWSGSWTNRAIQQALSQGIKETFVVGQTPLQLKSIMANIAIIIEWKMQGHNQLKILAKGKGSESPTFQS